MLHLLATKLTFMCVGDKLSDGMHISLLSKKTCTCCSAPNLLQANVCFETLKVNLNLLLHLTSYLIWTNLIVVVDGFKHLSATCTQQLMPSWIFWDTSRSFPLTIQLVDFAETKVWIIWMESACIIRSRSGHFLCQTY